MGTYTPTQIEAPDGLDELGLRYSMARVPGESLADFRRRLVLESRDRSGPAQHEFIRGVNRRIAQFEVPIFDIELVVDGDGIPLADGPFIEVTSTHLRAYSDKANDVLDFEVDFTDRADGKYLRDVKTAFDASSYFTATVLDTDHTYKLSSKLRYENTSRWVQRQVLQQRFVNDLGRDSTHLTDFRADDTTVFLDEKTVQADVLEDGDYYIDYLNGVVFTYSLQTGVVAYGYEEFPHRLYWQPVRAYPYNDSDLDYCHKDDLISDDTGVAAPLMLNSKGARIANSVLKAHSIEWGK